MEKEMPLWSLLLILLGVWLIIDGFRRYRKPFSSMYLGMTMGQIRLAYGAIPSGVGTILVGIAFTGAVTNRFIFAVLFFGGVAIAIIGTLASIALFKPLWLQRLEAKYGETFIELLRQEAAQLGYKNLNQRIRSQEDLDEWVAEVRRKQGLL